jgi:hypothetical protein
MKAGLTIAISPAYAKTDAEIIKEIIAVSIAAYPGNCPCPYNLASNGSQCGKRSAYSKPGGYSPICYESDVTPAMVESYKTHQK